MDRSREHLLLVFSAVLVVSYGCILYFAPTSIDWIASIVVAAGILGGVGGAFMSEELALAETARDNRPTLDRWWMTSKFVVLGVLSAAVVPLFLLVASPGVNDGLVISLVNEVCRTEDTTGCVPRAERLRNFIVFASLCVLAAIWGQSFLSTMIDRVARNEAAVAKGQAEKALKDLEGKVAEIEQIARNVERVEDKVPVDLSGIDKQAEKVLKAMLEVPDELLTSSQIATAAGLSAGQTEDILKTLTEQEFVRARVRGSVTVWRIGSGAKQWLQKNSDPSQSEKDVLRTLHDKFEIRPMPVEMAQDLGRPPEEIRQDLLKLKKRGYVDESGQRTGGWRIRSAGIAKIIGKD